MKKLTLTVILALMVTGIPVFLSAGIHYEETTEWTGFWPEFDGPAGVQGEYVVTITNLDTGEVDAAQTATIAHETGHGEYSYDYTIDEQHRWEFRVTGTDEFGRVSSCADTVAYLKGWSCPGPCYSMPRN